MLIGDEYYVLELSFNKRAFFVSLFCIGDETKHKVLELEDNEKTKDILAAFNNDYEQIAKSVSVVNGQIKIKRPRKHTDSHLDAIYSKSKMP
mmetsp:Transcript_44620/g.43264  ORF Transcript_44620/g.43264 Transcript_44620/m.43264 type:complete len:92 (+) Transcript_44620:581-856(+)